MTERDPDDGWAAAEWAESPDRTIAPDAVIHRGPEARAQDNALLDECVADDPEMAALLAKVRREANLEA